MTFILVLNFKRFCLFWVTVWDSVRELVTFISVLKLLFQRDCLFVVRVWDPVRQLARGDDDLYFSPKLLSKGYLLF